MDERGLVNRDQIDKIRARSSTFDTAKPFHKFTGMKNFSTVKVRLVAPFFSFSFVHYMWC